MTMAHCWWNVSCRCKCQVSNLLANMTIDQHISSILAHWNQYQTTGQYWPLEPVPDNWNQYQTTGTSQCRITFWCWFAFNKLTQQLYLAAWAGRIAWHPRLDALPWALGWGTGSADCCVWPWSWRMSPGNRDQGETQPKEGGRGRWGRGCEMGEDVRWGRVWNDESV